VQHPTWGDVSYPLPVPQAPFFQRSAALADNGGLIGLEVAL